MKKEFKNERVKNLEEITVRHVSREIEGCTSWRHFVVHQDRAWLLNAIDNIRNQVEKIRQAAVESNEKQVVETKIHELLAMFEQDRLNHLGDEDGV